MLTLSKEDLLALPPKLRLELLVALDLLPSTSSEDSDLYDLPSHLAKEFTDTLHSRTIAALTIIAKSDTGVISYSELVGITGVNCMGLLGGLTRRTRGAKFADDDISVLLKWDEESETTAPRPAGYVPAHIEGDDDDDWDGNYYVSHITHQSLKEVYCD